MPEQVRISGTIRTLDQSAESLLLERVQTISEHVCSMYHAECRVEIQKGYPILRNETGAVELARGVLRKRFGEENVLPADAVLGGEDFAAYLQKVPGCFFKVGSRKCKPDGRVYPTHQSRHEMNDDALCYAMEAGLAVLLSAAAEDDPMLIERMKQLQ